jgi:hypothetical protein
VLQTRCDDAGDTPDLHCHECSVYDVSVESMLRAGGHWVASSTSSNVDTISWTSRVSHSHPYLSLCIPRPLAFPTISLISLPSPRTHLVLYIEYVSSGSALFTLNNFSSDSMHESGTLAGSGLAVSCPRESV